MSDKSLVADVAAVGRIAAVPSILEMVCKSTGLRFAAVARVTASEWVACAVRDEIEFGLKPGGALDLKTTICDEIRDSHKAVIIDHVAEDPLFCNHHTPRMYGFQSYISTPIIRSNGEFFGTLCALDPLPANLSNPRTVQTFQLFSQLISLQLDVEERLEKSEQALLDHQLTAELREQFIAVLGHDLRNPLSSVTAGAYALSKLPVAGDSKKVIDRIRRSADRMAKLVDNIMDFARGRLGGGIPIIRNTEAMLADSLAHVVAELSAVHPDQRIELQLDLPTPVSCDAGRIGQLLSNLVSNAITHGAPGGPVHITARTDGRTFTLAVANEGVPIPAGTRERLFRPFSRQGADRRQEGLGLGLYIASQIAAAHEGTLDVESDAERTVFTLTMPATAR